MPKAIALMSGGLDSALAAKLVKDQGVEVVGLHLLSPFGCREDVEKTASAIGIPLLCKEKGPAYLDLVENPRYGYGRNMNPCIDCRIFMFQLADVVRHDQAADFIVTGEVLGQRPMSQQKQAMDVIDRNSPAEGLIVRPLSAHLFDPTIPEQKGWLDRDRLLGISGRGRKEQLALAQALGLKDYSAPGGGCLLTEAGFSTRLKDFHAHPAFSTTEERMAQSALLRLGRHFRFGDSLKVIVGRNQGENSEMQALWQRAGGVFFRPENFDGPSAVAIGPPSAIDETLRTRIGGAIVRYARPEQSPEKRIQFTSSHTSGTFVVTAGIPEPELEALRL